MKQIKLQSLRLRNFKGIKDFTFTPDGKNATILGINGAGKTTVYDGLLWLLFDKDSAGRKDFDIKPYDTDGSPIHFLDSEVEAQLSIGDQAIRLKKVFSEKWTKKRGQAEQEFSGHETAYWIDDVPMKKGEYQDRISGIIDEDFFKMLTNLAYFMALPWQDRRKMLMAISGDAPDDEIMSGSTELMELRDILGTYSVDEYKKILTERIRKLNKEIEEIPLRIDELARTIPTVAPDYTATEAAISALDKQIADIETEIATAQGASAGRRQKQDALFNLRNDLDTLKRKAVSAANAGQMQADVAKEALEREKAALERDILSHKTMLTKLEAQAANLSKNREALLARWQELTALKWAEPDVDNFICPTCGQDLPEEAKSEKITNMKRKFEEGREQDLDINITEGKAVKDEIIRAEDIISATKNNIKTAEDKLKEVETKLKEASSKALQTTATVTADNVSTPEIEALQKAIAEAENELASTPATDISGLLETKRLLQAGIDGHKKTLMARDTAAKTVARIAELKTEQRKLAQEVSDAEKARYLIEQFIRAKVAALTDGINSKFLLVKWKLFDEQINGGLTECCEALVNTNGAWVPYSTNANYGGRINAGLDIIRTLGSYFGIEAPVFIDNSESVAKLTDMPAQMIRLVMSPADTTLRVEVDGRQYPKSEQVAKCGNSVSPVMPVALVRSNLPEICVNTSANSAGAI